MPQVLYSGKMLESPNYLASVENGELVPSTTLNKFATEEEEWTLAETMLITAKSFALTAFDNNNPALWRIGDRSLEHGIYLAVTDGKVATRCSRKHMQARGFFGKSQAKHQARITRKGSVGVC